MRKGKRRSTVARGENCGAISGTTSIRTATTTRGMNLKMKDI